MFFVSEKARTKVIIPTLPIYIKSIIRSLDVTDRRGVIPVDSPTVPIAEITSNKMLFKEKGSIATITKVKIIEVKR